MWNKIKKALKKSWSWLKWILGIAGGVLLTVIASKHISNIGRVGYKKNWKPVPGDKTQVFIKDKNNKWIKVKLPRVVDKQTRIRKQVTSDDIKSIGLSYNIDKEVQVEIKHNPINRRVGNDTDSDLSI